MDIAVSHSILSAVALADMGETFRLHVPGRVVAFGRSDRRSPGYRHAVRIAEAHGYAAVERLAGGQAAVFHPSTLAFSWAKPDPEPRARTIERFRFIAELMADAFRSLAVDARVGAIPGEYCAGDWSVNVGGRVKVMGVGQRLVRNAAHVGGVVVVDDGHKIRDVLIPVYRSLQIDWDPRTAGSLADRSPGLDNTTVAAAIIRQLENHFLVTRRRTPEDVLSNARLLIDSHLPKVA